MIDIRTGKQLTRRDFGKGLAAIIAAGVAPSLCAASTGGYRRGLGARLATMVGEESHFPSADSYSKQNLVLLLDAEENVDFGMHDPNATQWKNLVGDDYVNIVKSGWVWNKSEKSVTVPATANSANLSIAYAPKTIEAVFEIVTNSNYQIGLIFSNLNYWIGIRGNNTLNFGNGGNFANVYRNEWIATSATTEGDFGTEYFGKISIWLNGVESVVNSSGMWNSPAASCLNKFNPLDSNVSFKWRVIRLYDVAISDEVRHLNYNIDKARFGIS